MEACDSSGFGYTSDTDALNMNNEVFIVFCTAYQSAKTFGNDFTAPSGYGGEGETLAKSVSTKSDVSLSLS